MNDSLFDTRTITWGKDGERNLSVRGLSTQDLTVAIRTHKDSLSKLFDSVEGKQLDDDQSLTAFGMELMEEFPELVALLIALAADMPDRAGEVKRLPVPIQLKLMMAVYQLTVEDTGGLQDFLSLVFGLIEKAKGTTHWLNSQRTTGTNTGT